MYMLCHHYNVYIILLGLKHYTLRDTCNFTCYNVYDNTCLRQLLYFYIDFFL